MKLKKTNILSILIFLAICILLLKLFYGIFRWKDTNGDYNSTFVSLYSLDDNLIDVVFLGPSYTYNTMNPAEFWEDCGLATFTMSVSGQDKNSTVGCLKEVLKKHRPKVVMVDAAGSLFDIHAVQGNVYRNTIAMDLSLNNIELINNAIELKDRADYILRWPIVHTRYKELQRYDFETSNKSLYSMGFVYEYNVLARNSISEVYNNTDVIEISETNKKWVDDLYALSEKYDFELVFYLTPGAADGELQAIINGFSSYLHDKQISFFDLNRSKIIDELDYSMDFADYRHMNIYGSLKLAKYMEAFLMENFDVTSHFGDPKYFAWEDSLTYKKHKLAELSLSTDGRVDNIIKNVEELEDVVAVIATEGNYRALETDLSGLFQTFGLTEDNYVDGGTFVVDKEQKMISLPETGEYVCKINSADNLIVSKIVGELGTYVTNVSVGTDYYRNTSISFDGVYVFIYDKILNKMICSVYLE